MLTTELTRRLRIEHPIVQAGMGDAAGRELASAVSNAGGLGTIGTIGRTAEQTQQEIAATSAMTDRPFAVNVFCFDWAPFAAGILDASLEAGVPVVTLSFGDPTEKLARCKAAGVLTSVQVQDLERLRAAIDGRADFIIVQGNEGGGHTGWRGTLNFVAQALDLAGDIPVVAAGGIANGRGLAAALAMGCAGVVMGTRFKATPEYAGNDAEKGEIVESDGSNTIYDFILDEAVGIEWADGITGRALRSAFTDEWEGRRQELRAKVAEYPPFGFYGELAEKGQAINWAGESSGLVSEVLPAGEVVRRTVAEAEALLGRVRDLVSAARAR
jgi:nitronate monooxygenase